MLTFTSEATIPTRSHGIIISNQICSYCFHLHYDAIKMQAIGCAVRVLTTEFSLNRKQIAK